QPADRVRVAAVKRPASGYPGRVAEPRPQPGLHHPPRRRVDRLDAERVGGDPVGPGRDLGGQVAVAGGGQCRRGGGEHVEVGQHGGRGGAVERLLQPVLGDRRAVGGVPVHGRGRGDGEVRPAEAVGDELGQVVDRAGPDGDRDGGPALGEGGLQLLDVPVLGVQPGVGEDDRLGGRQATALKGGDHVAAGGGEGVGIGGDGGG